MSRSRNSAAGKPGVGSELARACGTRFGSREKAILSQWEVGAGLMPGDGRMARRLRLIGQGRALEVLPGADDINGEIAELPPDSEIQPEWDAFMTSLAWPGTQARLRAPIDKGFQKTGDIETRLGHHTAQFGRRR